jgi:magnesium transporter
LETTAARKGEIMIQIFMTEDGAIHQKDEVENGIWLALTDPTATEILEISEAYGIDPDHLRAPLDEEERSRIELEDHYTLILVDIPAIEERSGKDWYVTIPLGIIITEQMIITICLEETPILTAFMDGRVKEFYTYMKTRFILQILYKNASMYLQYLRVIDKKSDVVERKLHKAQKNRELMELLELEKSLLYFSTSLRSNEVVLEKLMKTEKIKKYPEDTELLEDVIIENKQAIEMANIYSGNLNVTTEAVASVISNNLNIVMKLLTTITLVMSIPTMVASFYGMNVLGIPFAQHPQGFWVVIGFTLVLSLVVTLIFSKKDLF